MTSFQHRRRDTTTRTPVEIQLQHLEGRQAVEGADIQQVAAVLDYHPEWGQKLQEVVGHKQEAAGHGVGGHNLRSHMESHKESHNPCHKPLGSQPPHMESQNHLQIHPCHKAPFFPLVQKVPCLHKGQMVP